MENELLQGFKNILIPIDGSKLSENGLRYGVSVASKYDARIVILSVYSSKDPECPFKKRIKEMNLQFGKDIEKMPLMYLMENYHGILKNAVCKQKINVKSVLRESDTSTKSVLKILLDEIEKEKIDLVVISSHGKSGFNKLKLGSVTEGLIKSLAIPVLCVKK